MVRSPAWSTRGSRVPRAGYSPATMDPTTPHLTPAERTAALFATLPKVVMTTFGGSRGPGFAFDDRSDVDLEIYTCDVIRLEVRERIVMAAEAPSPDCVGRSYRGAADEWPDVATGLVVDASYFDAGWMSDQLDRILVRHEPSLGYSSCLWHTINGAAPLHDPMGWLSGL
jgi:hypothetical protein